MKRESNGVKKGSDPSDFIKVLVVEDDPVSSRMQKEMLSKPKVGFFKIESTASLGTALKILSNNIFDVILLDLNLPDSSGLNTLHKVAKEYREIAIVVITGAYDEELGLRAITEGATEYLIKGEFSAHALKRSISYAIERRKMTFHLQEAYAKLRASHNQLIQAEKMHAVGQLASGVAHEVKNPLGILLQGIDYLEATLIDRGDDISEVLKVMRGGIKRADGIVRLLQDFSRAATSELKAEDAVRILDDSLMLLKQKMKLKRIEIIKEMEAGLPKVLADENKLQQVFINLFLNAIHAVDEDGCIIIHTCTKKMTGIKNGVGLRSVDPFKPGERLVIIEITNTGAGISQENLQKVFDPFFTTKIKGEGVGLGLSICKNIIDQHGGLLKIENAEGRGVTVTVVLKIAKEEERDGRKDIDSKKDLTGIED